MAAAANEVTLLPDTVRAFDHYIREAEAEIDQTLGDAETFLWSGGSPDRMRSLQKGEVLAELWPSKRTATVPQGLIHDWIGAVLIPAATVDAVLAVIQDYNNHKIIYSPDVMDSKLISRHGDDFKIYMRLLKKKIITVVLDTDHDVHYSRLDSSRWFCRSHTTRIAEVRDAGLESETTLPPDTGHGFLWRLCSYWKLAEVDGGTLVECRAISLTRDIPFVLKWIIQPMVRTLPKEALVNTLAATRRAVVPESGSVSGSGEN